MESLADVWRSNARYNGDRIAAVDGDRSISFGEAYDRAQRLASAIHRRGLRKHDRVGMLAMNRLEWVEYLGATALGGTIGALINYRLAESYEEFVASGDPQGAPVEVGPETYAMLMYTSGTTGRPKGVLKEQRQFAANFETNIIVMNMRGDDRLLVMMPLFHNGACSLFYTMFMAGGTTHIHRKFEAVDVLATIDQDRITMMHMAPRSKAFMIAAGSFHATRTTGTVSVCEIACSMGRTSPISAVPCCRSTHSASNPWCAITSAV